MSRNWKSAKGAEVSFKWDEKDAGFAVEGYFFDLNEGVGSKGNSTIYTLKQDNGEKVSFWGSAVLDDQFSKFGIGTYCRVEYQGKKQSKGGANYHSFLVQYDDSDIMDLSANDNKVQESPVEQTAPAQTSSPVDDEDLDMPF